MNDSVLHTTGPNFSTVPRRYQATPAIPAQPTDHKQAIIDTQLAAPAKLAEAQAAFDRADRVYKALLVSTSIRGLGKSLFPGKDGVFRAASNDTERALAIDDAVMSSPELIRLAETRESALTALRLARDTFEAAKLIASLLSSNQ